MVFSDVLFRCFWHRFACPLRFGTILRARFVFRAVLRARLAFGTVLRACFVFYTVLRARCCLLHRFACPLRSLAPFCVPALFSCTVSRAVLVSCLVSRVLRRFLSHAARIAWFYRRFLFRLHLHIGQ